MSMLCQLVPYCQTTRGSELRMCEFPASLVSLSNFSCPFSQMSVFRCQTRKSSLYHYIMLMYMIIMSTVHNVYSSSGLYISTDPKQNGFCTVTLSNKKLSGKKT